VRSARTASDSVTIRPFFLPQSNRNLLLTLFSNEGGLRRPFTLFIPPFAEEMNKCRRMTALMARRIADGRMPVLNPDLTGTGDSDGEFGEATCDIWREDLNACAKWIADQGGYIAAVIGIRFGALLALELAASLPDCRQIILWQPVLAGETMIKQFLRLRAMAGLTDDPTDRETVADLVEKLNIGNTVEVAGYDISQAMYNSLIHTKIDDHPPGPETSVHWLHVSNMESPRFGIGNERAAAKLASRGAEISTAVIHGNTFWSTTETTICPTLIERTAAALDASHDE